MTHNDILWIMTMFALKHFVCDFPLQSTPWMYKNKGVLFHPGGLTHAFIHSVGTWFVLALYSPNTWILALLDGLIHYLIDFLKVNITESAGLKPDNSEWYWVLLGIDQLLHFLTYVGLVYLCLGTYT